MGQLKLVSEGGSNRRKKHIATGVEPSQIRVSPGYIATVAGTVVAYNLRRLEPPQLLSKKRGFKKNLRRFGTAPVFASGHFATVRNCPNICLRSFCDGSEPPQIFFFFLIKQQRYVNLEDYKQIRNNQCQYRLTGGQQQRILHKARRKDFPKGTM